MNLSIAQALRVESSATIAFVGAGGKTSAMFQLARKLPSPVIVTATSHLGTWQFHLADQHIVTDSPAPLEEMEHELHGIILVTGQIDEDRSKPIHPTLLNWLHQYCSDHSIPLLIEADGSRQKPMKAWAQHEPAIPDFVGSVVQVVGLTGLGKALTDDNVHRPEIFSTLSGIPVGGEVTHEAILRVITHPQGGIKNMPRAARKNVLLNHAETHELQATAKRMVQPLLSTFDAVVISSLKEERVFAVHERVAGI